MVKLDLKDKVDDGELDLSVMELEEVPVKEIAVLKHKVRKLDLSNNQLTSLQLIFAPQLSFLVQLDLSKNKISEIPENFGLLSNLTHLDLYSNKIERLPLSFKEMTKLKWLDLKDNPLTPQLAKIAGPCVDASDCKKCAQEVVMVMQEISRSLTSDKRKTEDEGNQTAPKEKKKKKKNKGGDGGRSQLNGGKQGLQTNPGEQLAAIRTAEELAAKQLYSSSKTAELQKKPPALSLRLCCILSRAVFWCFLLVGLFVGVLYALSMPQLQPHISRASEILEPYVTKSREQLMIWQEKAISLAGNTPEMLNHTFKWTMETASVCAVWMQDLFITQIPVYAGKIKNQQSFFKSLSLDVCIKYKYDADELTLSPPIETPLIRARRFI